MSEWLIERKLHERMFCDFFKRVSYVEHSGIKNIKIHSISILLKHIKAT